MWSPPRGPRRAQCHSAPYAASSRPFAVLRAGPNPVRYWLALPGRRPPCGRTGLPGICQKTWTRRLPTDRQSRTILPAGSRGRGRGRRHLRARRRRRRRGTHACGGGAGGSGARGGRARGRIGRADRAVEVPEEVGVGGQHETGVVRSERGLISLQRAIEREEIGILAEGGGKDQVALRFAVAPEA